MELSFAAATDVGRQRDHNEDNFLIDKKLRLFMVADGMGGHAAGEIASSIAVHEIRDAINDNRDLIDRYRVDHPGVQAYEVLQVLEHAVQAACSAVHDRAQAEPDKRGMGTTATVLLIAGAGEQLRGFIAHVGDSRVYLARQNQCHVLTEDHSLMNELVRRGKLNREQIESSPYKQYKNAVTRAVGVYGSVEVDTFDFDILPGDRFLLCSDGMYAYVDDNELPRQLAEGDIKEVPKKLIEVANTGGGHDNITAVVVRIGNAATAELAERSSEVTLKLEVLKGMQMFRFLSYKELVRISAIAGMIECKPDQTIFSAGQPGDAMYAVLSGTVRLIKDDTPVAELGRGQHFGEMALIDRSVRSLTAVAVGETRLVIIRRKDFYDIIKREPASAVKLLWAFVQVLGARLRKTTSELGAKHSDTKDENLFQD
ncbi:MAG TPA: cyclic nucleotide-binding domain-containing protein [Kofleriaceae bacterium]|nr:cyclic nucleotide-binding domain-containing protein [Kofleriaceae bacterium]